jgi:hypothetical protein
VPWTLRGSVCGRLAALTEYCLAYFFVKVERLDLFILYAGENRGCVNRSAVRASTGNRWPLDAIPALAKPDSVAGGASALRRSGYLCVSEDDLRRLALRLYVVHRFDLPDSLWPIPPAPSLLRESGVGVSRRPRRWSKRRALEYRKHSGQQPFAATGAGYSREVRRLGWAKDL